jgi:hypothetical protein
MDVEYLRAQGLTGTDANIGMAALRFLDIADEKGKVLESAKVFHLNGEPKKQGLQKMLKLSYQKLFEVTPEPFNLTKDDLTNEFVFRYGVASMVAKRAATTFLYLCEQAGLKDAKAIVQKRVNAADKKPRLKQEPRAKAKIDPDDGSLSGNMKSFPFLGGKIKLTFPEDNRLTEMVLSDEFRSVSDAIKKFGGVFFPEFPSEKPKNELVDKE